MRELHVNEIKCVKGGIFMLIYFALKAENAISCSVNGNQGDGC